MSEPPGATVTLPEAPAADQPSKALTAQRVLPFRRPERWIATAVVLVLVKVAFLGGIIGLIALILLVLLLLGRI